MHFIVPPENCAMVDWYLKTIRANRLKGETDALFLGVDGLKSIAKNTLSTQITKKVFQKTGLKFNVHLIRLATSLIYLNQGPGSHYVLRVLLGNKSIVTTLRFNSGAEHKSAVAHFDKVIIVLRDAHQTQPNRPRGRLETSQRQDHVKLAQAVLPDSGRLTKRGAAKRQDCLPIA